MNTVLIASIAISIGVHPGGNGTDDPASCRLLTDLTPHVSFILCCTMMAVATVLQIKLKARRVGA